MPARHSVTANKTTPTGSKPLDSSAPWKLGALALGGVLAALFPMLSMPACFFAFIGLVAAPRLPSGRERLRAAALAVSVLGSGVGLLRFVLEEAIPGVVAGGKVAIEKRAVSFLRALVTAQDRSRVNAELDPDGDGIGTALTLRELAGLDPLADGTSLRPPPIALREQDFVDTRVGSAVLDAGYLFVICLPGKDGRFVTAGVDRDPETAERRFLAYAWPEGLGAGAPTTSYFVDEHEQILMLETDPGQTPRYVGRTRPPECGAALAETDWKAWKDKQPKKELPGDGTVSAPSATGNPPP